MKQIGKSVSVAAALGQVLASTRLTVVVLLLLAVTSVFGTLIPQGGSPGDYLRQYGEIGYRLLYAFDLLDMYRSWWFRGLVVLLTANIVVCTWKRFPATWKTMTAGRLNLPAGRCEDQAALTFTAAAAPEALKSGYEQYFKRHFRRFRTEDIEDGFRIIGEKGRWTRLAVTGVHSGVVILLAGALIGSLFGFDGFVNIAEGERIERIRLRDSGAVVPLGFEIFCEDFEVAFYDTGAPREYRSRLHIIEDGRTVLQKDIIVNDPLRYKGINFFQSSYGSLPAKALTLSFTAKDTGEVIQRTAAVGQKVDILGSGRRFHLKEIKNNFRLRDVDVGETALGVMEKPDGTAAEVVLPMRFPTYDKMRGGEWIVAVEAHEHAYYTGLQVTRDPGIFLVYIGFGLLIGGCFVTFFLGHERVAVQVSRISTTCTVRVHGARHRPSIGFKNRLEKITANLKDSKKETI